jgi:hypothetical protein
MVDLFSYLVGLVGLHETSESLRHRGSHEPASPSTFHRLVNVES